MLCVPTFSVVCIKYLSIIFLLFYRLNSWIGADPHHHTIMSNRVSTEGKYDIILINDKTLPLQWGKGFCSFGARKKGGSCRCQNHMKNLKWLAPTRVSFSCIDQASNYTAATTAILPPCPANWLWMWCWKIITAKMAAPYFPTGQRPLVLSNEHWTYQLRSHEIRRPTFPWK